MVVAEAPVYSDFWHMKTTPLLLSCLAAGLACAAEPEWNAASIKECDRACLTDIMDGYMNAIFKHDPNAAPPLAIDVRMTENTGQMDVGEGMLWRSKVEPTGFKIYVADPVEGQVAEQARLRIQGRNALAGGAAEGGPRQDPGD